MRQRQPRKHDNKHLDFIRGLPCCVCLNNIETEAAHVRLSFPKVGKEMTGKGEKPHDRWTVPLCSECHRKQHQVGEIEFWEDAWGTRDLDPFRLALALHSVSGDHAAGEEIIRAHH